MKYIITFAAVLFAFSLRAQDCQLVSLKLPVPEGISKHHFPPQEMPANVNSENFFTYLSSWDQGEVIVKLRFSTDGTNWTKWEVLKKDFTQPETKQSPLHLASESYQYFEWAVFNKAGLASELAINFYYTTEAPVLAITSSIYETETSTVSCPQPELIEMGDPSMIVGNEKDD